VLIVDDLAPVRAGIRSLLAEHSFRVCGEATDGKQAIKKTRQLKPDIILMDINLPGMNGVKAAQKLRLILPRTKIVFLSAHNLPGVEHSTRKWADGFVSKAAAATHLVPLLKRLAAPMAKRIVNDLYDSPEGQSLLLL
jgi:two-component system nitrate/nitrite response regulator NarL